MDYKQTLIKMIDRFNLQSVEELKEIELKLISDSKSIFKKNKDYDGRIETLRKIKKEAQKIDPRSVKIPEDDESTRKLKDAFQRCILTLTGICDSYIQFETALKNKAEGSKIKFGDVKQINGEVREAKTKLNEQLNELNVMYADYNDLERAVEDEDFGGVKYMTYESIQGER
ncbi:MAG: hypothetical protein Q4A65_03695 [Bacillota bacterium]|nr:hypothetical protein [Bacillota bacterium]